MRVFLIAALSLALTAPCLAQTTDTDPATKDDIILYFGTMHSYDMINRMMEVQSQSMRQLMHDQLEQENALPADFDTRMKKALDELIKGMPVDEMIQAMIPAYQNHFTHGDITAMNAFYSSPVGQKVLQVLPSVMQEGMQALNPVLNKYLTEWKEKMQKEFKDTEKSAPKTQKDPAVQN